jgi:hypothetical protein
MFSTPQSLQKRTGKADLTRPDYLKQLAEEYKCESTSLEKKEQVLANLANFAYDPINYEYFRRLDILPIFIDNLKTFFSSTANVNYRVQIKSNEYNNNKLLSFSMAAICNLCLDPKNHDFLIKNDLISLTIHYLLVVAAGDKDLLNQSIETLLNAITILIFMFDSQNKYVEAEILKNQQLISLIENQLSKSTNRRLANLANLFLTDYVLKFTKDSNDSVNETMPITSSDS